MIRWIIWLFDSCYSKCSTNSKVSLMAADEFNNNTLPLFVHVPHFLFALLPGEGTAHQQCRIVKTAANAENSSGFPLFFSAVTMKNIHPLVCFHYLPFNPCGYAVSHRGATAPIHQTRIVIWSSPFFYAPFVPVDCNSSRWNWSHPIRGRH